MDWEGSGTGRSLPPIFLLIATISSLSATLLSLWAIYTHLKRYLKPNLQRHVVRLILIVPIFSTSSLLGLFSLREYEAVCYSPVVIWTQQLTCISSCSYRLV